jgi:hypothetical protein
MINRYSYSFYRVTGAAVRSLPKEGLVRVRIRISVKEGRLGLEGMEKVRSNVLTFE